MVEMELSSHFTLSEFIASEIAERKGIDNTPPPDIIPILIQTASRLEEIRALLHAPMHVNSGYRSAALNAEVGGQDNSQHMRGEACDFIAPRFGSPLQICRTILTSRIPFDQLIFEYTWVHVSFTTRRTPRRSVLTIRGRQKWLGIVAQT
jgi:hypothetical protein